MSEREILSSTKHVHTNEINENIFMFYSCFTCFGRFSLRTRGTEWPYVGVTQILVSRSLNCRPQIKTETNNWNYKTSTPISWRKTSWLFASVTEELNSAGQMRTKPARLCQEKKAWTWSTQIASANHSPLSNVAPYQNWYIVINHFQLTSFLPPVKRDDRKRALWDNDFATF